MSEHWFLSLMMKARLLSSRGDRAAYWHGYQRGLRRGFQGELYGTDAAHELWMRLAEDGTDKASRERGRGYRDGLSACGATAQNGSPAGSALARRGDAERTADPAYSTRR